MADREVFYTSEAERDLENLFDYIERHDSREKDEDTPQARIQPMGPTMTGYNFYLSRTAGAFNSLRGLDHLTP